MAELLPCPFCGDSARMVNSHDEDGTLWFRIRCNSCAAQTNGKWVSHRSNTCPIFYEEVRQEWNARTPSTEPKVKL